MGFSYGYNRAENVQHYRTGRELVLMLVDLVSRGGNLLLDIGPTADGRIPVIMEERLTQMGEWLKINGEAIYGTRAWKNTRQWSEGEIPKVEFNKEFMTPYDVAKLTEAPAGGKASIDAFFTAKNGAVYAILPRWPGRSFMVKDIDAGRIKSATLLGASAPLRWQAAKGGVALEFPDVPAGADDAAGVGCETGVGPVSWPVSLGQIMPSATLTAAPRPPGP